MRWLVVCLLILVSPRLLAEEDLDIGPELSRRKPEPTVFLDLEEQAPILGVTAETKLHIRVQDPPMLPMRIPRVLCSAGQVEDIDRESDNVFSARYILPDSHYPQPAIIVVEFPVPNGYLRGVLIVRLHAATAASWWSTPGATLRVRLGDKEFGPHTAPSNGNSRDLVLVRVPVVVPPGVDFAIAYSENKFGKSTETLLDLKVPYSRRVLLVAPKRLRAGEEAEAVVYAVEPSGRPAPSTQLTLEATPQVNIQPLGSRIPGEARFLIQAPKLLTEPTLSLTAMQGNQTTTRVRANVDLIPARPATLTLSPESDYLPSTPGHEMKVFLDAEDAFGNLVDASGASVLVNGQSTSIQTEKDDSPRIHIQSSSLPPHSSSVHVEAVLDGQYASLVLPVDQKFTHSTPPRRTADAPRTTFTPRVGALWNLGQSNGLTLFAEGMRHRRKGLPGFGLGIGAGLVLNWFYASDALGISTATVGTVPVLAILSQRFSFGRLLVSGEVGMGICFSIASVAAFNTYRTTGFSFGIASMASLGMGWRLPHGHMITGLRYYHLNPDTFSSGDHVKDNVGGLALEIGYRLNY